MITIKDLSWGRSVIHFDTDSLLLHCFVLKSRVSSKEGICIFLGKRITTIFMSKRCWAKNRKNSAIKIVKVRRGVYWHDMIALKAEMKYQLRFFLVPSPMFEIFFFKKMLAFPFFEVNILFHKLHIFPPIFSLFLSSNTLEIQEIKIWICSTLELIGIYCVWYYIYCKVLFLLHSNGRILIFF